MGEDVSEQESRQVRVVRYNDVEYPLITELTKREVIEAEQLAGSVHVLGAGTMALLLGYFSLRRADVMIGWDVFLDDAEITLEEVPAPLDGGGEDDGTPATSSTPETDTPPPGPTSSESNPG